MAAASDFFILPPLLQRTFQEVNLDHIFHFSQLLPHIRTPNVITESSCDPEELPLTLEQWRTLHRR